MSSRIIYVVCYDDESEKKAIQDFKEYSWARIYRIPAENQSHLFEGVMYQTELMKLYDEWKDKEFVGTISYKMKDRFAEYPYRTMQSIDFNILNTNSNDFDVYPFMIYTGANFQELHPNVKEIYTQLCDYFFPLPNGYSILKKGKYTREKDLAEEYYFFFNYWMTTPSKMLEYIDFFNTKWLPKLESYISVWNDAGYYKGKMTPEQLQRLTKKVSHYPYHPFINERLPSNYFRYKKYKIYYGA